MTVVDSRLSDLHAVRSRASGRWLYWIGPIAGGIAAMALYGPVLAGLVRQWYDEPGTAYGAWLIAAGAFVVRRRWRALSATPLAPSDAGFLLLAGALGVCAIGIVAGDLFLLRVSLPLVAAACVVCVAGIAHAKLLLAPLGLLLLAVPIPRTVVAYLTLPLQLIASQLATVVLDVLRVPVTRSGNLLVLPEITLEIAQACSGLQSVVSLVSVAAICAAVVPLSLRRGAFLIAAAIPVAIVGNGVRVAITGLLAVWMGEAAVNGTIHEATGHIAFLLMCAAIVGLLVITRPRRSRSGGET